MFINFISLHCLLKLCVNWQTHFRSILYEFGDSYELILYVQLKSRCRFCSATSFLTVFNGQTSFLTGPSPDVICIPLVLFSPLLLSWTSDAFYVWFDNLRFEMAQKNIFNAYGSIYFNAQYAEGNMRRRHAKIAKTYSKQRVQQTFKAVIQKTGEF